MSHIPNIETILKTMKPRKAAQNKETINKLADILLMTTSRNANQAAPAPSILAALLTTVAERDAFKKTSTTDADVTEAYITGAPVYKYNNGWDAASLRKAMTFSGPGAAAVYHQATLNGNYLMPGNFTTSQISQLVFHAWWGTYKEDFGVLRHITGFQTWEKRDQLVGCFREMQKCGKTIQMPDF